MDTIGHLTFHELLIQLPTILADPSHQTECVDFLLNKLVEEDWGDANLSKVFRLMAKELRGKPNIISRFLSELFPLLSRPQVLIEHLVLYFSESNLSEIRPVVLMYRELVKEDRNMVMSVLGSLGEIAALVTSMSLDNLNAQNLKALGYEVNTVSASLPLEHKRKRGRKSTRPTVLALPTTFTIQQMLNIQNEIFEICVESISLVDVADMPTLIRTLLFSLTSTNTERGLKVLREATQKFTAADMAPILPVLYTSLRLTLQLGGAFLTFLAAQPSFTLIDMYFVVIILGLPTPTLVVDAWRVLEEAFLKKVLNSTLLRSFALDAAEFMDVSEEICSREVLFGICEHLMLSPNPILVDIGSDFAVLLFCHFPQLRAQILDTLLATSAHALAQPYLVLDSSLLDETRTASSQRSHSRDHRNDTVLQGLSSLDLWRFPMRSLLELASVHSKFVSHFYLSFEDMLLQWAHKGQTVLIDRMLPHERRHWVAHMHCMAECLIFLAPFQTTLYGSLMMLIQKQTCSSNELAQVCGIVLAQHVIQSNYIEISDARFIAAHLFRTCPPMPYTVRTFYYEFVIAAVGLGKLEQDHMTQILEMIRPAVVHMCLFGQKAPDATTWNLGPFRDWISVTNPRQPEETLEHSLALVRCLLAIQAKIDAVGYQKIINASMNYPAKWAKWTPLEEELNDENFDGKTENNAQETIVYCLEISHISLRILETIAQAELESKKEAPKFPSLNGLQQESNALFPRLKLQHEFLAWFDCNKLVIKRGRELARQLQNFQRLARLHSKEAELFRLKPVQKRIHYAFRPRGDSKEAEIHLSHLLPFNLALGLIHSDDSNCIASGLSSIQEWLSYELIIPSLVEDFSPTSIWRFVMNYKQLQWPGSNYMTPIQTFVSAVVAQLPAYVVQTENLQTDVLALLLRQGATASGCSVIYKHVISQTLSTLKVTPSKIIQVVDRIFRSLRTPPPSHTLVSCLGVFSSILGYAIQLDQSSKASPTNTTLVFQLFSSFAQLRVPNAVIDRTVLQNTLEYVGSFLSTYLLSSKSLRTTQFAASFILDLLSRLNQSIAVRLPQLLENLFKKPLEFDSVEYELSQTALYWPMTLAKKSMMNVYFQPSGRALAATLTLFEYQAKWKSWRQHFMDAICELHAQIAETNENGLSHPVYPVLSTETIVPICHLMLDHLSEITKAAHDVRKHKRRFFSKTFLASSPEPLPVVSGLIQQIHLLILVIAQNCNTESEHLEWRKIVQKWIEYLRDMVRASIEWRRSFMDQSTLKSAAVPLEDDGDNTLDGGANTDWNRASLTDVFAQALHFLRALNEEVESMSSEALKNDKEVEFRRLQFLVSKVRHLETLLQNWSKREHIKIDLDYSDQSEQVTREPESQSLGFSLPFSEAPPVHMHGFQTPQLPVSMEATVNILVPRRKTQPNNPQNSAPTSSTTLSTSPSTRENIGSSMDI